ncbi:MAG: hypothetical protein VB031_02310 [Eubacteriaceae bacterium]|nr:hypothetical protein [Eubacteriaceae bacterium]
MKKKEIKKLLKDHVAKLSDYGNIKVLDFKRPDSGVYRMRFIFEEDYCRLHISGDLGALSATNFNNMCLEKFGDFTRDTDYFREKINCSEHDLFYFDEEKAKEELSAYFENAGIEESEATYYVESVLFEFTDSDGMSDRGRGRLAMILDDDYEAFKLMQELGKPPTDILDWYTAAFELACDDLAKQEDTEGEAATNENLYGSNGR